MPPVILSTASYTSYADALAGAPGLRGAVQRATFPDGEHALRIDADVDDQDVIVVGGTETDAATLELYDLASGAVAWGARRLRLVVPYYGYSTMERAVRPGDVVTAKTRARLLSAIPPAGLGNRLLLMDLHAGGTEHYFADALQTRHVYAKPVILEAIRALGAEVVASPDAGRAKWVESLAGDLGLPAAVALKRRRDASTVEHAGIEGDVRGRRVVLFDDMIRTGGSLVAAGNAYRDAGAASIAVVATHGVLPGNALERLRDSGLFERVRTTDTHPRARELGGDAGSDAFFGTLPTAGIFRTALSLE